MRLAHRPGRLTSWIAIFAILLAALAPSVARALSQPQQQAMPWTDICTVWGTEIAHDPAPASSTGQQDGRGLKHCPFCLNQAGQFVLPAAKPDVLPTAATRVETFPSSVLAPSPRFIRAAAQPRAPPANS
jgi:hypothetical protein